MAEQNMSVAKNRGVVVADSNKGKESFDIADCSAGHQFSGGAPGVMGSTPGTGNLAEPQVSGSITSVSEASKAGRGDSFGSVGADGGSFASAKSDPAAQKRKGSASPGSGRNIGPAFNSVADQE